MSRRALVLVVLVVLTVAALAAVIVSRTRPTADQPPGTTAPPAILAPSPLPPQPESAPGGTAASPAPEPGAPEAAPTPAPEPVVPVDLSTPAPGLDRELAGDYRKALDAQGVRITDLTIIDTRATGGVRRAEIVYRTATDGSPAALRPEVIRVIGPGANPGLALDRLVVRAIRANGTAAATVTVTVVDLDRWLKAQITDDEFYGRWIVERPGR
jgi:hypothetical protein